jgi:integrase
VVIERKRPQILTVEQAKKCATVIRHEFPVALGWLALALFCGLRPEEAEKLQWSGIDLQKGIVTVDAAASKVRWRRLVYCTPCSIQWLTKAKALNASLPIPRQTRRRALALMGAKLGFNFWPKDILRHTCASMLMATWEDRLPRRSPNSSRAKPGGQGRRFPRQFAHHPPRSLPGARHLGRGEEILEHRVARIVGSE